MFFFLSFFFFLRFPVSCRPAYASRPLGVSSISAGKPQEASSCAVRWVPFAHSLTEARKLEAYVAQVASLRRPCRADMDHNLWDVGTPTCGGSEEGWKARQKPDQGLLQANGPSSGFGIRLHKFLKTRADSR